MSTDDLTPTFIPLLDTSDVRGFSYSMPSEIVGLLSSVRDVHSASVVPGAIRGNHFHALRHEIITVFHEDAWSFAWDVGEGSEVMRREFVGRGAVSILVPPGGSHAIHNTGERSIWMVALSDHAYDEANQDVFRRVVARG